MLPFSLSVLTSARPPPLIPPTSSQKRRRTTRELFIVGIGHFRFKCFFICSTNSTAANFLLVQLRTETHEPSPRNPRNT